jgi:hypothetical protein
LPGKTITTDENYREEFLKWKTKLKIKQ